MTDTTALPYRRVAPAWPKGQRFVPARRLNSLTALSTMVLMAGIAAAWIAQLYATTAEEAFRYPAPFVGAALVLALLVEARAGLRNLVRIDLFMLSVLYLLTFLEFLFPLPPLPPWVTTESAQTAVKATLLGFGGIALGRHAFPAKRPLAAVVTFRVAPKTTMLLLTGCEFFGYLYMLLAVNFDIAWMIEEMGKPRFSQPWTRGRYGSLSTLLNEVGLLKYLLPPLAASVLAQGRRFNFWQKGVALAILALVFYESFAGGTRNIFLTHLVTFTVTCALLMRRLTLFRLTLLAGPMLAVAWLAIYYMPEIRTVGLENFELEEAETETLFVDMNLVNVALLTQAFPDYVRYLGFEVPYIAAIRPIPRGLWSGKPEGLSVSIEEVIGVSGMTLSATFVGELWMAGGYLAVAIAALCFGVVAARWNRIGASADNTMKLILFAAGFFPAGIGMRSFMSVAPTVLPIIGLLMFMRYLTQERLKT